MRTRGGEGGVGTLGEALRRWSFYCKSSLPTPFSHQALLPLPAAALIVLVLKLTERSRERAQAKGVVGGRVVGGGASLFQPPE